MIPKKSRKSTYRLLLVITLLLGVLTLSGCTTAAVPATSSDPVGIGLSAVARPLENVGIAIAIKNNMTKFVSDVKVQIVSIDGNPGIAPFALWQTPDASVALTEPLLPGKTAQARLLLQQKSAAPIKSYAVDVSVSYRDGDGNAVTKVIPNAGIIRVGSTNFLSSGIRWIIEMLYKLIHNYAVAIILLTLALKLISEPLTRMQFKSTVDMQKLQPQLAKLKAKYPNKEDATKLNQETMQLYKDNNVNVFSGCLPLLVQWPVFLALFTAINNYSPFNNAAFLWAPALSMTSSALPLATRFIMPVLVGVTTYIQSVTSFIPGQDRSQTAMLTYFMPILMGYWAYGFSIALGLYWSLFSLFSAIQQYYVIKRLTKGMALPEPVVAKRTTKKK
ncbi:MAG: YidC/Oxa1 family membrane protein insertase [Candidatus Cryosericum sp.]|nr:YidC/Oxa1 family membrane protein insertase [bacterium]